MRLGLFHQQYAYGKFLQAGGATPRLSFACFRKTRALMETDDNKDGSAQDQAQTIDAAMKAAEAKLDSASIKTISSDLNSVLQEALTVKL